MSIVNQGHNFHEILEQLEEVADQHGTQVVYVDNCEDIDPEAPQFCEKFIIDSYGAIMLPVTINGEEW
jgi:hypothetical protein